MDEDNYILMLSSNYITFDPLVKNSSVFYDDNNRQIFVIKNFKQVIVKGPDLDFCQKFEIENNEELISVKFSTNFSILAIQRNQESVSFINFDKSNSISKEYIQFCRRKSIIIGIIWTSNNHIVFLTSTGLEFYQVYADKMECKLLKNFSINISWFVYEPSRSILLLATGTLANIFQPFQFQESTMYKLNKFEIELTKNKNKSALSERDVAIVNIYGKTYLLIIHHQPNDNYVFKNDYSSGSYIALYSLLIDSPFKLTHILQLCLTGKFAINVVDDIIVVHHQTSQTSLLFDINLPEYKKKGIVFYYNPLVPPYTIKPFKLKDNTPCELYSTNWFITQPNIIIDPKLGCLWVLQMNLLSMCRMLSNETLLFDFLIFRRNSKNVLLNLCNRTIMNPTYEVNDNTLSTLSFLFKKLNQFYKNDESSKKHILVDQNDMFKHVFSNLDLKNSNISDNLIIAILFEYINSLICNEIPIQYFIYELLINLLIKKNSFYQLQQFLQYHVFSDSNPLACLILSLNKTYPPALQLALDMFKRLNLSQEYILDIFIEKMDILRAIRFLSSNQALDSVSARKYLDYSAKSTDKLLFYSVFKCFQERNFRLRGSFDFAKDEQCEIYVKHFEKYFGTSEL